MTIYLRGRSIVLAIVIALSMSAAPAFGDWASIGSDHDQLKGFSIAAVGQVVGESKYNSESFERLEWVEFRESYRVRFCFRRSSLGSLGSGERAALLLVNEKDEVRVAIFDSFVGSIKVEIVRPEPVQCPSQ